MENEKENLLIGCTCLVFDWMQMCIRDRHAAQERVKYEEYRESIGGVDGSQQQLLVPYIFESVSYTHLDVYKRQELHRLITSAIAPEASAVITAVSYTHLDVYKRQAYQHMNMIWH